LAGGGDLPPREMRLVPQKLDPSSAGPHAPAPLPALCRGRGRLSLLVCPRTQHRPRSRKCPRFPLDREPLDRLDRAGGQALGPLSPRPLRCRRSPCGFASLGYRAFLQGAKERRRLASVGCGPSSVPLRGPGDGSCRGAPGPSMRGRNGPRQSLSGDYLCPSQHPRICKSRAAGVCGTLRSPWIRPKSTDETTRMRS
jgi:hypothetical protein